MPQLFNLFKWEAHMKLSIRFCVACVGALCVIVVSHASAESFTTAGALIFSALSAGPVKKQ